MKTMATIRGSLLARVALLALASGLLVLGGLVFAIGSLNAAPTDLKLVLVVLAIIALPAIVGWLTLRLVMRPLNYLAHAIASLRTSENKTNVKSSGINEFDTILLRFQSLTVQLHQEEELRKNLISDTSHELNTPIAAMASQLVAMQEGKLPVTKQRINILKEQTERLNALVKGLDAYSRARLPQTTDAEDIPIRKMCQRLLDELEPRFTEQSIQVTLAVPDALTVRGNYQAFQQILHNWAENALHYSGATEARIGATQYGMTLSDNGRGVPDKDMPHLFERFYRVEKSRNRTTGGLGLGLAIVKELVEHQGWAIRAEAANPGLALVITFNT